MISVITPESPAGRKKLCGLPAIEGTDQVVDPLLPHFPEGEAGAGPLHLVTLAGKPLQRPPRRFADPAEGEGDKAAEFAVLFGTDDQSEGMKAFLEKREPMFKGK